jgi:hypothetical protein
MGEGQRQTIRSQCSMSPCLPSQSRFVLCKKHKIPGLLLQMACLVFLSPVAISAAQPSTGQAALLCEAVYMPAQTVWPRTVTIEYDQRRIKAVSIDGVKVYTFNVRDTWILTSMDNERIQINTATLAWTSDFRGLASAQGRCDWLKPSE